MSSEPVNKKKRAAPEAKPPAEGDHRKRRRNRTTQSCLNCHTSKRMCDRRRPACSRCTQLGLTGLCVYEVDDPSQRSDPNDESSRLLKRVAELEGVIRELKNKPHPRWVQPRPDGTSDCGSPKDTCKPSDTITSRSPASTPPFGDGIAESHPRTGTMVQIPRYSSSPLSSPSPTITPASESPPGNILINPTDLELSTRMDLTTLFSPYPGPLPSYEDNCFGTLPNDPLFYDSLVDKAPNSRCSCLSDTETYNALLELSLRLRKAAQVLGQSRCHRIGSQCALNQRIAELDAYTSNKLTSMDSMAHINTRSCPPAYLHDNKGTNEFGPKMGQQVSNVSPHMMPDVGHQWDLINMSSDATQDSFMTWEPSHRK